MGGGGEVGGVEVFEDLGGVWGGEVGVYELDDEFGGVHVERHLLFC
jgi:hypothetical protein